MARASGLAFGTTQTVSLLTSFSARSSGRSNGSLMNPASAAPEAIMDLVVSTLRESMTRRTAGAGCTPWIALACHGSQTTRHEVRAQRALRDRSDGGTGAAKSCRRIRAHEDLVPAVAKRVPRVGRPLSLEPAGRPALRLPHDDDTELASAARPAAVSFIRHAMQKLLICAMIT